MIPAIHTTGTGTTVYGMHSSTCFLFDTLIGTIMIRGLIANIESYPCTKPTHTQQTKTGEKLEMCAGGQLYPETQESLDRHIYCEIGTIYSSPITSLLMRRVRAPPPSVGLRGRLGRC